MISNRILVYILGAVALFGNSCTIETEDSNPVDNQIIVVDSHLYPDEKPYTRISTVNDISDPNPTPPITNATVYIKYPDNQLTSLAHVGNGVYSAEIPDTLYEKSEYQLLFDIEGTTYQGKCLMPKKPIINNLSFEYLDIEPIKTGYYLTINFQDEWNVDNYYWWKVYKNGELTREDEIILTTDIGTDGKSISYIYQYPFSRSDTVSVSMMSLSKSAYLYYNGLKLLVDQNYTQSPDNPTSNLSGEVIGFFNAATIARDTTIVQ